MWFYSDILPTLLIDLASDPWEYSKAFQFLPSQSLSTIIIWPCSRQYQISFSDVDTQSKPLIYQTWAVLHVCLAICLWSCLFKYIAIIHCHKWIISWCAFSPVLTASYFCDVPHALQIKSRCSQDVFWSIPIPLLCDFIGVWNAICIGFLYIMSMHLLQ